MLMKSQNPIFCTVICFLHMSTKPLNISKVNTPCISDVSLSALSSVVKTPQGAFTFRGSMIDMPSVKQAQNILTLSVVVPEK